MYIETAEEIKDAILSLVITRPGCWERYSEHALEKEALILPRLAARVSGSCAGRQSMCTLLARANSINWIDMCDACPS